MEKYVVAVHLDEACENLYFLVDKEVYEFIIGETFSEDILNQLVEVYADYQNEYSLLKSKFEDYFRKERVLYLANAFAHFEVAKVFGYKIHSTIQSLFEEIRENHIKLISAIDIIVTDDDF